MKPVITLALALLAAPCMGQDRIAALPTIAYTAITANNANHNEYVQSTNSGLATKHRGYVETVAVPNDIIKGVVDMPGHYFLSGSMLSQMPTQDLNDYLAILPGVYQRRRGDGVRIYGSK